MGAGVGVGSIAVNPASTAGSEPTILHLVTDLRLGGTQRILLERVRGLRRFRHAVLFFAPHTGDPRAGRGRDLRPEFEAAGARLFDLGLPTRTRAARAWLSGALGRRGAEVVRETTPALLHSTLFHTHLLGDLLARRQGLPHLASKEGTDDWMGPGERAWERRVLSRVERAAAVSEAVAIELRRLGVGPERIAVIPNGIDPAHPGDWAMPPAPEASSARARSDRLLGIGRLEKSKGWEDLIEALALVRQSHPEASLDLLGTGSLESRLRRQAARLGLAGCVRLPSLIRSAPGTAPSPPAPSPPAPALPVSPAGRAAGPSSADEGLGSDPPEDAPPPLVVVPSREEGFGLVLVEAMARGCALVACAVGGIPEIARHEQEALLVPPARPRALAAAIDRLLSDPGLSRRLAQAARARAGLFTAQRMVQAYGALYDSLLSGRDRAGSDRHRGAQR